MWGRSAGCCAYLEGLHLTTHHKDEHEVLLPRQRKFHVDRAEHKDGVLHLHVYMPSGDQPAPPLKLHPMYKQDA